MHVADPLVALKLPAGQAVQFASPSPVYPTLHLHSFAFLLAIANVDAVDEQSLQKALPAASLYVPAGQAVQLPPSSPV